MAVLLRVRLLTTVLIVKLVFKRYFMSNAFTKSLEPLCKKILVAIQFTTDIFGKRVGRGYSALSLIRPADHDGSVALTDYLVHR